MTEKQDTKNPDWDRHEWAGEEARDEANPKRWSDKEWAGEPATPEEKEPATDQPTGPTGGGHSPSEQHWVPEEK